MSSITSNEGWKEGDTIHFVEEGDVVEVTDLVPDEEEKSGATAKIEALISLVRNDHFREILQLIRKGNKEESVEFEAVDEAIKRCVYFYEREDLAKARESIAGVDRLNNAAGHVLIARLMGVIVSDDSVLTKVIGFSAVLGCLLNQRRDLHHLEPVLQRFVADLHPLSLGSRIQIEREAGLCNADLKEVQKSMEYLAGNLANVGRRCLPPLLVDKINMLMIGVDMDMMI